MNTTESARPRIVLIGAGWDGQKYLEEMTARDVGGDLTAVVDIAPDLEERFPVLRERHIPVFSTIGDFAGGCRADLAVISSPIHLHAQMITECLALGMHVLCEKPLCMTERETLELSRAARAAGRFLAVGWQLNYDRAVRALKSDILSGRFGAPRSACCLHAMRRGENYYARSAWAGRVSLDGRDVFDSPFMNACAHHFQLMTFLLGPGENEAAPVKSAEGELFRGNPHVENYDIAFLRFMTGDNVPVCYYTAHPLRTKNLGQEGRIVFEHATVTWGRGKPFAAVTDTGEETVYGMDGGTPLMQKLDDAVRAVRTGETPLCGPEAGLPHLQAVLMAQRLPVTPVPKDRVEWLTEGGDRFPCVTGLEEALRACRDTLSLPKEKGISPWASN